MDENTKNSAKNSKSFDDITSEKIFEIIGVYFANCYWNNLYALAQENWKEGKYRTIQEAYEGVIDKYSKAFRSENDVSEKKHYDRIIKDLYINYRDFLQSHDTLIEFIDRVSKFLLPNDFYKTLTSRDPKKDTIFRNILTKSIARFTIFLDRHEIEKVTNENNRQNKNNLLEWKKKFIDFFIRERDEFCTLLMAKTSGVNLNKDENWMSKEICDKLRNKIKDLVEEKSNLIKQINDYVKYVDVLKNIIKEKETLVTELEEELMDVAKQNAKQNTKNNKENKPTVQQPENNSIKETEIKINTENATKKINESPKNKALEQLKNEEFSDDEVHHEDFDPSTDYQIMDDFQLKADD